MTSSYRFIIHSDAFRLLLTYRSKEREIRCDFFQYLASNPSLVGEYEERDKEGRVYEVIQVRVNDSPGRSPYGGITLGSRAENHPVL